MRVSGGTASQVVLPGVPLGSFAGSAYDEVSFDLVAGDVYVFCTDGVFEANDDRGGEFGIERLTNIVLECRKLPAKAIVESVFTAVADFRGEVPAMVPVGFEAESSRGGIKCPAVYNRRRARWQSFCGRTEGQNALFRGSKM